MKFKFKYVGGGEGFYGIPARDLNEADWAALSPEQRRLVEESTLYQAEEQRSRGAEEKDFVTGQDKKQKGDK